MKLLTILLAVALLGPLTDLTAQEPPATEPGDRVRVVVCQLTGTDLPRSGLQYLSELVQQEVAKAESLKVIQNLLICGSSVESVVAAARTTGASMAISGRIARVGDLFVVELKLVNVEISRIEAEESVELVSPLLDPRIAVRTATQRLVGIGGWDTLKESYVNISSTPGGAKIFVNGLLEGNAPIRIRVASGNYRIKATLSDYAAWALDVNVMEGETLSLNAALAEAQGPTQLKTDGGDTIRGFAVPYVVAFGEGALYLAGVKSGRPYLELALVGGPTTYFAASDAMGRTEIGVGQAWMIASSGLWGAAWGLMGAGASGLDEARPYVGLSMLASGVGIFASSRISAQRDISADSNLATRQGQYPLVHAVACVCDSNRYSLVGDRIIELLLAAGADPNCRNPDGDTPLGLAVSQRMDKVQSILKTAGAEI
jgi:hypothetical protein